MRYSLQKLTLVYSGIWSDTVSLELALIVHQLAEF